MKRTLSSSRTFNNINNSSGISAADKQQITDNKNNITLLDTELTDLSGNTVAGITLTVTDLSTNYYAYKVSNNAALATTNGNVSTNTGNISSNTSAISSLTGTVSSNTSAISTNTGNISSNASAISSLTGTVSSNTSAISTNAGNIATNTSGLAAAVGDIATIESAATTLTGRVNQNETTLLGKQDTLSSANTSAGNVTLRTLNFPNSIAANVGNITLPGDTQLFSGNAPGGAQAKIQNGNLFNFASINTTLLTNVTLGTAWKYQNGVAYPVVNATTNDEVERINPSNGQHNWYSAGNTAVVMAWQPQNDRLLLSGAVLANKFLHTISGTVVRGYGFFRFQGTSGTVNMNTTGGIDIPWTNVHVDGQTFLPVGTTQVKIVATGYYEIGFNVYLTSTVQRANPTIRIRVNGLDTAYLAWSYIRSASNHNESSWSLSPVLISLAANDLISVQGRYTTNGITGGCFLYSNSAAINKAYSSLMLKRVA